MSGVARLTVADWLFAALLATAAGVLRVLPGIPTWARVVLWIIVVAEAGFFVYGRLRLEWLGLPDPWTPPPEDLERTLDRFLQLEKVFPMDEYISGWFFGTPFEQVPKENVLEYVSYGMLYKRLREATPAERKLLEDFLIRVEERWDVRFPEGHDPSLRFMEHIFEPLRAHHKPLICYLGAELAARTAHALLWYQGFGQSWCEGFSVWHLPPRPAAGARPETPATSAPATPGKLAPLTPLSLLRAAERGRSAALDVTLDLASMATAAVSAQYPHAQQQYHMPVETPRRPRTLSPSPVRRGPGLRRRSAPHAFETALGDAGGFSDSEWDDMAGDVAGGLASGPAGGDEPLPVCPPIEVPRDSSIDGDAADAHSARRSYDAAPRLTSFSEDARKSVASPGALHRALPALRRLRRGQLPIVFLHGVGFGVLPYLHFLRNMVLRFPAHPVLLVEVPHVALRLCPEAVAVDDVARGVRAALAARGYEEAIVVGHSYGTFVASRFVQLFPECVHALALLDPVCMLICYPQLLHNFIYRQPTRANFSSVAGALDLVRFVCSRDLTISQAFCRKFRWSELNLWPEDLPSRAVVVLAARDDLVPAALVQTQLEAAQHPARVLLHPELGHGGLLLVNHWQTQILDALSDVLEE